MATITKKKSGWFVQVRRKGYEPEYRTFGTKVDAEKWAREREARIDRGDQPVSQRELRTITLSDLILRYVEEITPSKQSAETERMRLLKMSKAPVGLLSLHDLSTAAVVDDLWRSRRILPWDLISAPPPDYELATAKIALHLLRIAESEHFAEWLGASAAIPKLRAAAASALQYTPPLPADQLTNAVLTAYDGLQRAMHSRAIFTLLSSGVTPPIVKTTCGFVVFARHWLHGHGKDRATQAKSDHGMRNGVRSSHGGEIVAAGSQA